jgi:hypothetical protein
MSWGSISTDLRKMVSMKETIGGASPPISFGSFFSDLGVSAVSLKKSIIGTSPPANVKKWLISPFDTSATSEDDISNMQAVGIAGLKVDDTEVTRDAVLVTFISKWEGPLAITAQVAKSQVRGIHIPSQVTGGLLLSGKGQPWSFLHLLTARKMHSLHSVST